MSPHGQVRALLRLRWALVRSQSVQAGIVLALLGMFPLGALMLLARTGVEPAALVAAQHAAPAAFLGFGALAVIAPLTSSAGGELFPSDQLVAFPIRPSTVYLSSLLLTPVNLVWVVQLLVLTSETGFLTVGTPSLAMGGLTSLLYVVACTLAGQALAWLTVGLRRSRRGRLALRTTIGVLLVSTALVVRFGDGGAIVDHSFAPAVTRAVHAAGIGDVAGYLPCDVLLAVSAVVALLVGRRACAWALRRPTDRHGDKTARAVRRRATPDSALAALVAIDRGSVWRAPALRRGALVLAVLPGLAALGVGMPWRSLVFLPGLVAAGAGLLFGFNSFCLDGGGAVWLATLPQTSSLLIRAKLRVIVEVVLLSEVLAAGLGALRASGTPTPTELVAVVTSSLTCGLLVVALCLAASVRRPHRADLNGPRDAVAPPGAMMVASARLAFPAALVGGLMEATASTPTWWFPLFLAAPVVVLASLSLNRSLRLYDEPLRRSRITLAVSAG